MKKELDFFKRLLQMAWVTREYPKYPNFVSGRVGSGPFHGQVLQVQNSEYPKERAGQDIRFFRFFAHVSLYCKTKENVAP